PQVREAVRQVVEPVAAPVADLDGLAAGRAAPDHVLGDAQSELEVTDLGGRLAQAGTLVGGAVPGRDDLLVDRRDLTRVVVTPRDPPQVGQVVTPQDRPDQPAPHHATAHAAAEPSGPPRGAERP